MRQIRLDRKDNSAEIDFNKFFYPLHLLQQGAAAFKEVADISVKDLNQRALVTITPKGKESSEQAALYFCNFALGLKRELGENA